MKPTLKKIGTGLVAGIALFFALFHSTAFAQGGKIHGKVSVNKKVPEFASVKLLLDSIVIRSANANEAGEYAFYNLDPGTYNVKVVIDGMDYPVAEGIILSLNETRPLALAISVTDTVGFTEKIPGSTSPLFTVDPVNPITMARGDIDNNSQRGPRGIVAQFPGTYQPNDNDPVQIRGARPGSTAMYIDGVKSIGTDGVPNAAMEQVTLFSNGIPAEFGDVTGGVINVTTRNPGMKPYVSRPKAVKDKKPKHQKRQSLADEHAPADVALF